MQDTFVASELRAIRNDLMAGENPLIREIFARLNKITGGENWIACYVVLDS